MVFFFFYDKNFLSYDQNIAQREIWVVNPVDFLSKIFLKIYRFFFRVGGVTMNVYRAECVTELGSNNSEPEAREASVGRTYASAHKQLIGGTADRTFLTITQKVFVVEKK